MAKEIEEYEAEVEEAVETFTELFSSMVNYYTNTDYYEYLLDSAPDYIYLDRYTEFDGELGALQEQLEENWLTAFNAAFRDDVGIEYSIDISSDGDLSTPIGEQENSISYRDLKEHIKYSYCSSGKLSYQELIDIWNGLTEEELDKIGQEIEKNTDGVATPSGDDLYGFIHDRYGDYTFYHEPDIWINATIDPVELREFLYENGYLEDNFEDEEEYSPVEKRIIYRFDSDNSYVVDLLPSELEAEGEAQGICVGDQEYGYGRAILNKQAKIFSWRKASGKRKFTIEAHLTREGDLVHIHQIKGKANRLPGYSKGVAEGKLKFVEVDQLIDFVSWLGIDPEDVSDLKPALRERKNIPIKHGRTNPKGKRCRSCGISGGGFCTPFKSKVW